MLLKTHLVIAVCIILVFISHVNNPAIFVATLLVATLIPEADSGFLLFRRNQQGNVGNNMARKRGILHSFTFCLLVTILFSLFVPVLALPFFLGYAFHLFADAWSVEGIRPFWPMKTEARGAVNVGGRIEHSIFIVFILIDILLLGVYLFK